MTGIETAAALAAAGGAAGTGAAIAAPVAAGLGAAGAAGTAGAITAAEASALGLSAEAAGTAAAGGLTAAEVAGAAAPTVTEAGILGGTEAATGTQGLLGAEAVAPEALNSAGYLAPEMGAQEAGLLANSQQAAPIVEQGTNAGLLDKANYATNGNLGQVTDFLGEKPMGEYGPTRGKMISQGGKTMLQPEQQQQQPGAPAPQRQPQPFRPSAGNSPYARQVPIRTTNFGQYLKGY